MSTERFEKTAGSGAMRSLEDRDLIGIGTGREAKWVRVPADFPVRSLAGQRVPVERVEDCGCFACEDAARRGQYAVAEAEADGLAVGAGALRYVLAPTPLPIPEDAAPGTVPPVLGAIECAKHGFLWHATDNY